jgi:alpha/beta superfamily hydrolase
MHHETRRTISAGLRSLFLNGPSGQLEALLNEGHSDAPYSALVCHPHPLYGGTMHTKAVYHTAKALNGFGFPVLRFNFRGVGRSAGEHAEGHGEVEDVRTALDWLDSEFHRPIIAAGFSFGAAVNMKASCPDPRVSAIISLGTPISAEGREYQYRFLSDCTKPKLFLSGGNDQYGARPDLEHMFSHVADPKRLVFVDKADHFFEGHLPAMRTELERWIRDELLAPGGNGAQKAAS